MAQYLKGLGRNRGGRLSCVKAVERLEISEPHFRRFHERDRGAGAVDQVAFVVECTGRAMGTSR